MKLVTLDRSKPLSYSQLEVIRLSNRQYQYPIWLVSIKTYTELIDRFQTAQRFIEQHNGALRWSVNTALTVFASETVDDSTIRMENWPEDWGVVPRGPID